MQAPSTFSKPKQVPLEALAWLIVQRRDPHMRGDDIRVTPWPWVCPSSGALGYMRRHEKSGRRGHQRLGRPLDRTTWWGPSRSHRPTRPPGSGRAGLKPNKSHMIAYVWKRSLRFRRIVNVGKVLFLASEHVPRQHLRLVKDGPRLGDEYVSIHIDAGSCHLRIYSTTAMIDDPSILLFISIAFRSSFSSFSPFSSSSFSISSSSPLPPCYANLGHPIRRSRRRRSAPNPLGVSQVGVPASVCSILQPASHLSLLFPGKPRSTLSLLLLIAARPPSIKLIFATLVLRTSAFL
jgi:hypothetical protein